MTWILLPQIWLSATHLSFPRSLSVTLLFLPILCLLRHLITIIPALWSPPWSSHSWIYVQAQGCAEVSLWASLQGILLWGQAWQDLWSAHLQMPMDCLKPASIPLEDSISVMHSTWISWPPLLPREGRRDSSMDKWLTQYLLSLWDTSYSSWGFPLIELLDSYHLSKSLRITKGSTLAWIGHKSFELKSPCIPQAHSVSIYKLKFTL